MAEHPLGDHGDLLLAGRVTAAGEQRRHGHIHVLGANWQYAVVAVAVVMVRGFAAGLTLPPVRPQTSGAPA